MSRLRKDGLQDKRYGPRKATKEQWMKRYEEYKELHEDKARKLARRGLQIKEPLQSFPEYRDTYMAIQNKQYKRKARGKIKNIGNINEAIASEDAYGGKYKQTMALLKGGLVKGYEDFKSLSLKERIDIVMRISNIDDEEFHSSEIINWDKLAMEYEYKTLVEGKTPEEAHKEIQALYFSDSP